MQAFDIDMKMWPVVVLKIVPHLLTVQQAEAMNREWDRIHLRRERFIALTDAGDVIRGPGADVRRVIGKWADANRDMTARYCLASVNVLRNPIARGAITAIHWIWNPPNPQFTVATMKEALDRSVEVLTKAGIAVPPALAEQQRSFAEVG